MLHIGFAPPGHFSGNSLHSSSVEQDMQMLAGVSHVPSLSQSCIPSGHFRFVGKQLASSTNKLKILINNTAFLCMNNAVKCYYLKVVVRNVCKSFHVGFLRYVRATAVICSFLIRTPFLLSSFARNLINCSACVTFFGFCE